jgi:soluble lytic murein transglycosylase-like protein
VLGHRGLMRRSSERPRLTTAACLLCIPCFAASAVSQNHIALILNNQGQPVYVNSADPQRVDETRAPDSYSMNLRGSANAAPERIKREVERTARQFKVDPRLVNAIIRVESQYNARAVSPKGAMGLMQLVPATVERFDVRNPFDPSENIRGGVSYLRYLLNLFDDNLPLTLAAYNAGENAVLRVNGIPPFAETKAYVRKVTSIYGQTAPATMPASAAPSTPPITSYVDAEGVMHFTNDGGT